MSESFRLRAEEALLPSIVALLIALILGDVLILMFGESPAHVYSRMIEGAWGNPYGFAQVLYKTTTLTFAGLGIALALRAGLFNIGAEGQLAAGAFGAAIVGISLPAGTPGLVAVPLCLLGAAAGGLLTGGLPGVLKAKFGAHEVIVTIMLNFVVLALLNWLIVERLRTADTLHTPEINAGAVPRLSEFIPAFHGSAANVTFFFAIAAAIWCWWYLFRTPGGYALRATGLQPDAAEYSGIRVGRVWIKAMALGGMLAALGGTNFVLGYKHYYEDGFTGGSGFLAIAVAIVGRNHPFGVVIAAFFFATLSQGGLAIHALVPKQMVEVLQGIVILAMAAAVPEVQRALRSARKVVAA
ncbi:MAG: ABC transporter permease [Gemmatimonadaceae bacterium]|nr:ABC transporter permease [Gemmatimonadaceae bacterium]